MLFSIPIAFTAVILSLAPKAVPSGTRRRTAQLTLDEHCPPGLSACRIPGGGDYECLSTQTEIESCGGCVYGALGLGVEALAGAIDCTSLPGVRFDSVTCQAGQCVVSACRKGYTLVNGHCIDR